MTPVTLLAFEPHENAAWDPKWGAALFGASNEPVDVSRAAVLRLELKAEIPIFGTDELGHKVPVPFGTALVVRIETAPKQAPGAWRLLHRFDPIVCSLGVETATQYAALVPDHFVRVCWSWGNPEPALGILRPGPDAPGAEPKDSRSPKHWTFGVSALGV